MYPGATGPVVGWCAEGILENGSFPTVLAFQLVTAPLLHLSDTLGLSLCDLSLSIASHSNPASTADGRPPMSAQDATKSTTAPRSASGRYQPACDLGFSSLETAVWPWGQPGCSGDGCQYGGRKGQQSQAVRAEPCVG